MKRARKKPVLAEPKRRNHVALALMQRKSGGGKHAPSPKARRQDDRAAIRSALRDT